MASSLPSSPVSPSLPSSPSSLASDSASLPSDASSTASLPSSHLEKKHLVASVDEVRHIIKYADTDVHLKFRLAPETPLAEAHLLWYLISSDDGGHGELVNPDVLGNKEEALRFVKGKLDRLRRWKGHVDRKHVQVLGEIYKLKKVIDTGGPGVPAGYEAHRYGGAPAVLDVDQDIDEKELDSHIAAIEALFLQGSPASPATFGDEGTIKFCLENEAEEQLDIAHFNLAYLQVKAGGLELLSAYLQDSIRGLEESFVYKPTHLGAGDANFVRFVEIDVYSREAPREA